MIRMLHFLADRTDEALTLALSINTDKAHSLTFVNASGLAQKIVDFGFFYEIGFHVQFNIQYLELQFYQLFISMDIQNNHSFQQYFFQMQIEQDKKTHTLDPIQLIHSPRSNLDNSKVLPTNRTKKYLGASSKKENLQQQYVISYNFDKTQGIGHCTHNILIGWDEQPKAIRKKNKEKLSKLPFRNKIYGNETFQRESHEISTELKKIMDCSKSNLHKGIYTPIINHQQSKAINNKMSQNKKSQSLSNHIPHLDKKYQNCGQPGKNSISSKDHHHPDYSKINKKDNSDIFNIQKSKLKNFSSGESMVPLLKKPDSLSFKNGKTIGQNSKFTFPKQLDTIQRKGKNQEQNQDGLNFQSEEDGIETMKLIKELERFENENKDEDNQDNSQFRISHQNWSNEQGKKELKSQNEKKMNKNGLNRISKMQKQNNKIRNRTSENKMLSHTERQESFLKAQKKNTNQSVKRQSKKKQNQTLLKDINGKRSSLTNNRQKEEKEFTKSRFSESQQPSKRQDSEKKFVPSSKSKFRSEAKKQDHNHRISQSIPKEITKSKDKKVQTNNKKVQKSNKTLSKKDQNQNDKTQTNFRRKSRMEDEKSHQKQENKSKKQNNQTRGENSNRQLSNRKKQQVSNQQKRQQVSNQENKQRVSNQQNKQRVSNQQKRQQVSNQQKRQKVSNQQNKQRVSNQQKRQQVSNQQKRQQVSNESKRQQVSNQQKRQQISNQQKRQKSTSKNSQNRPSYERSINNDKDWKKKEGNKLPTNGNETRNVSKDSRQSVRSNFKQNNQKGQNKAENDKKPQGNKENKSVKKKISQSSKKQQNTQRSSKQNNEKKDNKIKKEQKPPERQKKEVKKQNKSKSNRKQQTSRDVHQQKTPRNQENKKIKPKEKQKLEQTNEKEKKTQRKDKSSDESEELNKTSPFDSENQDSVISDKEKSSQQGENNETLQNENIFQELGEPEENKNSFEVQDQKKKARTSRQKREEKTKQKNKEDSIEKANMTCGANLYPIEQQQLDIDDKINQTDFFGVHGKAKKKLDEKNLKQVVENRNNYERAPILTFIYGKSSHFLAKQKQFQPSQTKSPFEDFSIEFSSKLNCHDLVQKAVKIILSMSPWLLNRIFQPYIGINGQCQVWLYCRGQWQPFSSFKLMSAIELLKYGITEGAFKYYDECTDSLGIEEVMRMITGLRVMQLKNQKRLFKELNFNVSKGSLIKGISFNIKKPTFELLAVETTPSGEKVLQLTKDNEQEKKDPMWVKEGLFQNYFDYFLLVGHRQTSFWTEFQIKHKKHCRTVYTVESFTNVSGSLQLFSEKQAQCRIQFYRQVKPKMLKFVGKIYQKTKLIRNVANPNPTTYFDFNVKGRYYIFIDCPVKSRLSVESASRLNFDFLEFVQNSNLKNDTSEYVQVNKKTNTSNMKNPSMNISGEAIKERFIDYLVGSQQVKKIK